ncbi:hypothetical protein [Streptomyces sp. NPDC057694]|uniref:hypothetical protein n=1 Tax=Streptomyces sp. NPDC057694 TaxID=3346216 RepID=UPI00367B60D2
MAAPPRAAATTSVLPFALDEVALGEGVFAERRRLMLDFGRGYDEMRLVQVFRGHVRDTVGDWFDPADGAAVVAAARAGTYAP